MIRFIALFLISAALVAIAPLASLPGSVAMAQGNTDDRTPLNSRIPRSRPLPTEPRSIWEARDLTAAQRARSNSMTDQLSRCLWNRSNELGLDLLSRTDFGFMSFEQIGIANSEVADRYPVQTCMSRVALNASSGLMLRFDAPSMRSWYIQAAYFDRFEDEPTWIVPGGVINPRDYPLSAENDAVQVAMAFADCVVAQDPYGADYFFRTAPESDEEFAALEALVPAIGPCLPQGQQMEIIPRAMKLWIGEGVWHASNNLVPAPTELSEEEQ